MNDILIYAHGSSANHGCEALARTTISIIRSSLPDSKIYLSTQNRMQDEFFALSPDEYIDNKVIKRLSPYHFYTEFNRRILKYPNLDVKHIYKNTLNAIHENMVCLSIGGDNYCYDTPVWLYVIHEKIKEKGAKSILWGCSIDIAGIDERMLKDLKQYDLIIARESITYKTLVDLNANNNIVLAPDPAFTLPIEAFDTSNIDLENCIGINLSPLILRYESKKNVTVSSYVKLLEYILQNTTMTIALVPHVEMPGNSDYNILQKVYNDITDKSRVFLVSNQLNSMQYKYVISKCRMFIGARTHATIAAYSTCIPTVVIGYSVKSKGIATDIFGSDEKYVLAVQQLSADIGLINAFQWLLQNETSIRNHLNDFMPGYIAIADKLSVELKKLCK